MNKSWGFLEKIRSGEKTIESRWYHTRRSPWGKIQSGDVVYFKDAGSSVSVRAYVGRVVSFSELSPAKVRWILRKYGKRMGIEKNQERFFEMCKMKRYCMLLFLERPESIEPFSIDKRGFGSMSAWITVEDVTKIRR